MAVVPIMMAVGTAMSAMAAMKQAQAQAGAMKFNATIAEQNATSARDQATAAEMQQRTEAEKRLGAMRASYGASGVTMEGSPLDVLSESASMAELDAQNIRYQGDLKARGYQNTAELDRANASNAKSQGYMKAGSELLMGATRAYTGYRMGSA